MADLEHTPEAFLVRLSLHVHLCKQQSCICSIILKDYCESHSQDTKSNMRSSENKS